MVLSIFFLFTSLINLNKKIYICILFCTIAKWVWFRNNVLGLSAASVDFQTKRRKHIWFDLQSIDVQLKRRWFHEQNRPVQKYEYQEKAGKNDTGNFIDFAPHDSFDSGVYVCPSNGEDWLSTTGLRWSTVALKGCLSSRFIIKICL